MYPLCGIPDKTSYPPIIGKADLHLANLIGLSSSHSSIMTEQKKQLAIAALVIWLLLVIFFMILARSLSLEIFFVLWLIGILVIVELIGPAYVRPSYLQTLKYLIAAGVIVFGVIVAQKVLEILAT
jgi:hypothetical protein